MTDKKLFCKTVCLFFCEKRSKITLLEKNENLKNDANIAKTFNIFLKNKVSTIKIGKYKITLCNAVNDLKI